MYTEGPHSPHFTTYNDKSAQLILVVARYVCYNVIHSCWVEHHLKEEEEEEEEEEEVEDSHMTVT